MGLYEDGTPGELFVTMAKEGSTISGLMDSFATAVSYALQYGVPLKFFVDKFSHVRFEPSGWTGNPTVPYAKSIMDYIFRWLGAKFLGPEYAAGEAGDAPKLRATEPSPQQELFVRRPSATLRRAAECGGIMTRNGSCYKCGNCGVQAGVVKGSTAECRKSLWRAWRFGCPNCSTTRSLTARKEAIKHFRPRMFWPILGYVKTPHRVSDVPGRSESSPRDSSGRDSAGSSGAPGHCLGAVGGRPNRTRGCSDCSSLCPGGSADSASLPEGGPRGCFV